MHKYGDLYEWGFSKRFKNPFKTPEDQSLAVHNVQGTEINATAVAQRLLAGIVILY